MSEARIWLVGSSGSGKSTLGKNLAQFYQIPYVELDAINHQANWQPLDAQLFRARVEEIVATAGWIIDGNYRTVSDVVKPRTTLVIFLDLTRRTILYRIIKRSLSRILRRTDLWNGNRESIGSLLSFNPGKNVWLWALLHFRRRRRTYLHPEFLRAEPGTKLVHLRSQREIDRYLRFLVGDVLKSE